MGAKEKEAIRHSILSMLARTKRLQAPLSGDDKLLLVEGFSNNYRASALQFLK